MAKPNRKKRGTMRKILIATNNPHKLQEIRAILGTDEFEIVSPADLSIHLEVEENGNDYQENALIKARAYREFSDYLIIADDSGLEIAAWDNQPGVHSARFLSEAKNYYEKNQIILQRMRDVENREAVVVSVAALLLPDGEEIVFTGRVYGTIAFKQNGEQGFGYDPLFCLADGRCMAELSAEEKNRISHRALAFRQIKEYLQNHEN